ncbi:hypothetical protein [Nocardia fluminea]|uniref:hypothetical protein n=1 Tax=Nocardia fluminea TaxID=134984 RepID=UPI0034092199
MTRPYRLIIWGPGDMGGRALRTALASPDFEVVGVKVFSPHKHGKDIGELAGLAPVGITATAPKAEILALKADCVVHTPTTPSLVQGADADVLDLLESGKNVSTRCSPMSRTRCSAPAPRRCGWNATSIRCLRGRGCGSAAV